MTRPRLALVTGATDGIGKAAAGTLSSRGWQVVITGRSDAKCAATVAELQQAVPGAQVSALVADLSLMEPTRALAREFIARHERLDALVLNANSITQQHTLTADGIEANLAVGFASRLLLAWRLQPVLERTPGATVTHVVGLNLERFDFSDPSKREGFSSMKALGRWQWGVQVFTREWNRRVPTVAMNVYMPGLVKTKILANEPQPMRLIVQVANALLGVPVSKGGDELATVVERCHREGLRDAYFARLELKPARALKDQPGDGERVWDYGRQLLARWLD